VKRVERLRRGGRWLEQHNCCALLVISREVHVRASITYRYGKNINRQIHYRKMKFLLLGQDRVFIAMLVCSLYP
jgi:hypothetical protein